MRLCLLVALALAGCTNPTAPPLTMSRAESLPPRHELSQAKVEQSRQQGLPLTAHERKQYDLKERVYDKDWNRWYKFFRATGYTRDEARFKASRIMRGR